MKYDTNTEESSISTDDTMVYVNARKALDIANIEKNDINQKHENYISSYISSDIDKKENDTLHKVFSIENNFKTVLEYTKWYGEILSIDENKTIRMRLSNDKYATRVAVIKQSVFVKRIIEMKKLYEGEKFIWCFKTIQSNKGTIKKIDSIDFFPMLNRNANVEKKIDETVNKLSCLFKDE